MISFYRKHKNTILNLSLKKIYSHFFLNDLKTTSYYVHLKSLIFEFLRSKYSNYDEKVFDRKLNSLIKDLDNYKDITGELNTLFNPEFNNDLPFHYKYNEKKIFFKFILYSLNNKLITNKYSKIYEFAINEINEPLNILEIGGGLPHGFVYNTWKKGKFFLSNLTYIDANLLHSEFVEWYCKKIKISHEVKLFTPAKTPILDNIKFNFVFAKDIFEHLDAPEILIDYLISNTNDNKTLLCLDLEHKGEKQGQHISPNLPILKKKLIENNFEVIKEFNDTHIWRKKL